MACRGVHFAISQAEAERLLAAGNDNAVLQIVQDEIEERWDESWLFESDKAWDAIHRCLTDGTLDPNGGSYPLKLAILNGHQLHSGPDYIVSLVNPTEVRDVAAALARIDRDWLKQRYEAIKPNEYGGKKGNDDWEYTVACFDGLSMFFEKAVPYGRYVIFTVDQ